MHSETNEQGFMQDVMQKNVSLGFVLLGGWTWSSTFLDEVTFYAVDLVQHIGLPGVWGAQSLDQVQALKCDLVQIPLGPGPIPHRPKTNSPSAKVQG